MLKISDSSVGTQKQIGFQTIKQPDSARREKLRSLTTAKAISKGIALGVDPGWQDSEPVSTGCVKANVLLGDRARMLRQQNFAVNTQQNTTEQ